MFGRPAILELTHNWGTESDQKIQHLADTVAADALAAPMYQTHVCCCCSRLSGTGALDTWLDRILEPNHYQSTELTGICMLHCRALLSSTPQKNCG
jgi:hypothetical protein